uniref:Uncharacterized protein n=1 Tax=Knipowitschia caucasica TaxID=637954 RepID=A0AAV2KV62_KNICA
MHHCRVGADGWMDCHGTSHMRHQQRVGAEQGKPRWSRGTAEEVAAAEDTQWSRREQKGRQKYGVNVLEIVDLY